MNNFSAIGRIGRDAETRHTQGGNAVTSFPLAVDSGYGQNKKSVWWDCALWGERGIKLADYLRKGDQIGVQGEVSMREYEKGGVTKTVLCLRVNDVTLLAKGNPAPKPEPKPAPRQAPAASDAFPDDDIPF
jgi:single-strand DNA-binding protein